MNAAPMTGASRRSAPSRRRIGGDVPQTRRTGSRRRDEEAAVGAERDRADGALATLERRPGRQRGGVVEPGSPGEVAIAERPPAWVELPGRSRGHDRPLATSRRGRARTSSRVVLSHWVMASQRPSGSNTGGPLGMKGSFASATRLQGAASRSGDPTAQPPAAVDGEPASVRAEASRANGPVPRSRVVFEVPVSQTSTPPSSVDSGHDASVGREREVEYPHRAGQLPRGHPRSAVVDREARLVVGNGIPAAIS